MAVESWYLVVSAEFDDPIDADADANVASFEGSRLVVSMWNDELVE